MMRKISLFIAIFIALCFLIVYAKTSTNLRDPFAVYEISETNTFDDELFVYSVIYRDPSALATILKQLYPNLSISAELESRQLIIKTIKPKYELLYSQIRKLDQPLEQIMIEVRVIETADNYLSDLGIQWQYSQNGINISDTQSTKLLIERLSFLNASGKASILANPKITTILGKEAIVHIGDKIPYTVPVESTSGKTSWDINYLESGVNLKITPQKADNGLISLTLQPEVSSIKQWKSTQAGDYPVLSSRQVSTTLRVKDGESFVIGGLINQEERENIRKIPVLGDIPLINNLFKYSVNEKYQSDILFLVTAKKLK